MNYASRYRNSALSSQSYLPFKVSCASCDLNCSAAWHAVRSTTQSFVCKHFLNHMKGACLLVFSLSFPCYVQCQLQKVLSHGCICIPRKSCQSFSPGLIQAEALLNDLVAAGECNRSDACHLLFITAGAADSPGALCPFQPSADLCNRPQPCRPVLPSCKGPNPYL